MKKLLFILLSISTFAQNDLSSLKGKYIYYYGDSITFSAGAGQLTYADYLCNITESIKINKAIQGTTMMKQIPIDKIAKSNMETAVDYLPKYNSKTDGLLFISFLTNDVGLFYPDYTLENYGKAIDYIIEKAYQKGWNKDIIKFNVRYFITEKGIDYTDFGLGVPRKATLERYNQFADLLKSKLDDYGIQYFDHWDSLSSLHNPISNLDVIEVHPNGVGHKVIFEDIIKDLYLVKNLSTDNFNTKEVISNIQYYNLLGQRISHPKGITIVKSEKNGIKFTKKIIYL